VARSVSAGEVIKLRVQFKDDLGKPTTSSNAKVYIFQPDADTSDVANSIDSDGFTPTYLGEGVYEYQYTLPCTPLGVWSDKWIGDLTCQTGVNVLLTFEVASGTSEVISFESPQLSVNNIVSVKLLSTVAATTGESLTEDLQIEFLTALTPFYSNLTKVKLEVGSLISEIKDLTTAMAVLEASLEADSLTFSTVNINEKLFQHARREYVSFASSYTLVTNVGGNLLKSKTLGDLSVTYDTASHQETLNYLQDMMRKWGDQLMSGGGAKTIRSPKMVIKGVYDVDRPLFDRMWEGTSATNKRPTANASETSNNIRRSLRTHKKRWW